MQIYAGTLRYISVPAVALLMTACGAARLSAPSSEEHDVSYRMYHHRVVACGLERWSVKTGTDSAARRVNTRRVVNTSIAHMRSLSPPAYLPSSSRIRPVETTVFRIRAVLLQIKEEADSDFHLVLADSRGRTMIAEIPAPQCVGLRSPFTGKIQYARRVATARLHP
ncbi:MAG: hypothetical protein ACRDFX_02920, partial [Chloroflexota bacterium]